MESSLSGESTFLKKLSILVLGLPGVFKDDVFFAIPFDEVGTFDLVFGRGVRGFGGSLAAIVKEWGRSMLGGVGGRPVEGTTRVSTCRLEFSRGFRKMIF